MQTSCSQLLLVPDLCFRSMDGICCSIVCFPLPHINYYESDGLHLKVGDTDKVSPFPLLWTIQCCMLFMAFVCSVSDSAVTLAKLALGWFGTEVVSKELASIHGWKEAVWYHCISSIVLWNVFLVVSVDLRKVMTFCWRLTREVPCFYL